MNRALISFAALLVILPFPGTVAARLLFLLTAFLIALWQWFRVPGARAPIPGKAVIAVWLAVSLLSLIWAVDPGYSAGEIKNELGYTMMAFFAFFTVARNKSDAVTVLRALACGMAIMIAWGAVVWFGNGLIWDEQAGHGGSGIVATYVVTAWPALLWLALEDPSARWRKTVQAIMAVSMLLGAITVQRAMWPALTIEAIVAIVLLSRTGRLKMEGRRFALYSAIFVIAIVAGMILSGALQRGSLPEDSRLSFWPGVVATIAAQPLIGAGFGRQAMSKAYPLLIPESNTQLLHAHNVFLNYGLAMGIPGVLAVLAVFVFWVWFFWQRCRPSAPNAIASVAGLMLVFGVVTRNQFNDFFMRDMSMMFWALLGIFTRRALAENTFADSRSA